LKAAPPRVVLDTNVVLSALLFEHGRLAPLRRAWLAQQIEPLASRDTIAELIGALAYPKFRLAAEHRTELLGDYLPYCRTVEVPAVVKAAPACADPADQMFLHLAFASRARWLVTGDRGLLRLATRPADRIVTPRDFLAWLAAR